MNKIIELTLLIIMLCTLSVPYVDKVGTDKIKEELVVETQTVKKDVNTLKREQLDLELERLESIEDNKEWFVAYKDLIAQYVIWCEPPQTIHDVFTEEEINLICRVVETETYQRNFDCKANVASVVLNRYSSGRFGDTITEVVTKPYQFAYVRTKITEETLLAVEYAFEIGDTTQGALFFNSFKDKRETFCGADYIFSDDAVHHFYK